MATAQTVIEALRLVALGTPDEEEINGESGPRVAAAGPGRSRCGGCWAARRHASRGCADGYRGGDVMRESRNEQYPILPPVDWASKAKQREARQLAVDERNALIAAGGAAVAVTAATGGNIGGGGKKAKQP